MASRTSNFVLIVLNNFMYNLLNIFLNKQISPVDAVIHGDSILGLIIIKVFPHPV